MRAPNEWAAAGAGPPRLAAAGRKRGAAQGAGFGICISVYLYLRYIEAPEATGTTRCSHLLLRFTPGCRAVTLRLPRLLMSIFMRGRKKT